MWFRQLQVLELGETLRLSNEALQDKLAAHAFTPCLPSLPMSTGWVSPHSDEEDAPLVRTLNGCSMICLQIEEKILPASVVRHQLLERIKKIEREEDRKMRQKQKYALKDEIIMTLLPRAFSRYSKVYAYIDTRQQWLVLGSTQTRSAVEFIKRFKQAITADVQPLQVAHLPAQMTHWLAQRDYPTAFSIETAGVLQDPAATGRIIRCRQQDLFADAIQNLLQSGCHIKQLALNWQDQVSFTLADPFVLQGIRYQDEVTAQAAEMEAESAQQQFDADFLIMSDVLAALLKELLASCGAEAVTGEIAPIAAVA